VLATLGLGSQVDSLPERLSGGEKQRVAVARALVRHPALMLADEPTASLDDASAAVVIDAIRNAAHRDDAAVLLVTHDPRVFAMADRRVHLADGLLTERPLRLERPMQIERHSPIERPMSTDRAGRDAQPPRYRHAAAR
jgi:putative ABC transport system ATP-binding protein